MAISIGIENLSRRFGEVVAVDNLQLEIKAGEFFTLLGSSGSGKSTLLKVIAGFDKPTTGRVLFDGADVTRMPANRRPCNTVFQDLALFPHMTVAQNVGFGLRVRREAKSRQTKRVRDVLQLVDLDGYQDRNIAALSGGQRQRVALARSLIMEPGILLLDEPLTGLDERLRQQMRDEFGRLHKKTAATFVLVTHNQDEALSLSDRMAIMHLGKLEQVGTPNEILHRPVNEFVARFVGLESIVTPDKIEKHGSSLAVSINGHQSQILDFAGDVLPKKIAIRSDRLTLEAGSHGIPATLIERHFRGRYYECTLALKDGTRVIAEISVDAMPDGMETHKTTTLGLQPGALVPIME